MSESSIADRLSTINTKLTGILSNANTQLTDKGKPTVSDISEIPTAMSELKNPAGTINITENGTVDVTNYAEASVDVQGGGGQQGVLPNKIKFSNSQCTEMNFLATLDTSNVTNMVSMFSYCGYLESVPFFDTSNVANMNDAFNKCRSLISFPILCTDNLKNMSNTFGGCDKLSDESLNNILQMCANATAYSFTKTLSYIGLNSTQRTKCTTLSNWPAAQAAGWTTGD